MKLKIYLAVFIVVMLNVFFVFAQTPYPGHPGLEICDLNLCVKTSGVGIGTSTPISKLEILGDITSRRSGLLSFPKNLQPDSESFYSYVDDSNTWFISEQDENSGAFGSFKFVIDDDGTGVPVFDFLKKSGVTGIPLVRIGANGMVGIGKSVPAAQLDVNGNARINFASFARGWSIEDDGGTVATLRFDSDKARFWAGNAAPGFEEVLTIEEGGDVGIGTANPTEKLEIGGVSGVDGIKFPDGTLQTTAATAGGSAFDIFPEDGGSLGPIPSEVTVSGGITGSGCTGECKRLVAICPAGQIPINCGIVDLPQGVFLKTITADYGPGTVNQCRLEWYGVTGGTLTAFCVKNQ